ncbi:MAG TPA: ribosome maturation factor RimM [Rubrobacteraceae bacterium]|nr:ribosome maturation factor RimM [Rubrobacteraceae bacterium]
MNDPVVIGVIGTPHGVRGTVRVRATGSGRHLREGMEPRVGSMAYEILSSRPTPKGFLLDLKGIGSRAEALALRGKEMVLDRSELDSPEDEEFYVADLVGLSAHDSEERELGEVIGTFQTPAHEVLVIRPRGASDAARDFFVPFTLEHVPGLDPVSGRIVVRPPEE